MWQFLGENIFAVILTFLSAYLLWRTQNQKEQLDQVKAQLSEKKYKVYTDVISILFDILNKKNEDVTQVQEDVGLKIRHLKSDLVLYAPDPIYNKYVEWFSYANTKDTAGNPKHFILFLDLMILIRKDMGHKKTKMSREDILRLIMGDENDVRQMKQLLELA